MNRTLMFEENPYVVLLLDDEYRLLDCNPEAIDFFGFTERDEMLAGFRDALARNILDGIPSDPLGILRPHLRTTVEKGRHEFDFRMAKGDRVIQFHSVLKRVPLGNSHAILAYLIDLGFVREHHEDQLRHEAMLKATNSVAAMLMSSSHQNFHSMFEDALRLLARNLQVDGVVVWRNYMEETHLCCRRIYSVNETHANAKGEINFSDALHYDAISPEWREKLSRGQCIRSVISEVQGAERRHFLKIGIASVLSIPIFFRKEFWGFIGFYDSQNERAFSGVEENVMRSAAFLLVSAIIRNESMETLIEAREAAIAGALAKSAFLANTSHEIRTPLNTIVGMSTIARNAGGNIAKVHNCMGKICTAATHLLKMINNILDISKIEAQKLEFTNEPFLFWEMMRNVYNMNVERIDEKNLQFNLEIDERLPRILLGDEARMSQVVNNLLSNAVKFTPPNGTIALSVRETKREENASVIEVRVSDTGIGIMPDRVDHIFDAFDRTDEKIARIYGGSGLGLAISKNFIEHMGGKIWVESEPGKGSVFAFSVRIVHPTGPLDPEEDFLSPASYDFTGKNVLLAEDIEINQEIFASLLEQVGVTVDIAENGSIAYNKFRENPRKYDMIFMDVKMPFMDGLEATRMIRAIDLPWARKIPILAFTANVFEDDLARCINAGMNDHLTKPIDLEHLFKKMGRYMAR